jgi:hypothetical protein
VVESPRKKQFSDYDRDEINDRGIPRPKIVRASRSNLDDWMRPTDEQENPNIQYLLFKTIYHLALSRLKSNEQKRDDLTGVLVFNRDVLRSYHANLPEKLKRRYHYEPHIAKSISRMLTSADTFQMFDRTATTISFTKRGAMLAEALFSDERRTVQNEIRK